MICGHEPYMTETQHIEVDGLRVEVIRKAIRHLYIRLHQPTGSVRVTVPLHVDDATIRRAIVSRLGWIRRRQAGFVGQRRQLRREMVTGEVHHFQGRRYRLDVVEHAGPAGVRLVDDTTLELRVRPGADSSRRRAVLEDWYRSELRERIPALIHRWEPVIGVRIADWRIRRMKTRWGSCNTRARRIWLNLELIRKPAPCLEYVLVHEMVHLLERRHNARFRALMDRFMPHWQLHHEALQEAVPAHEPARGQETPAPVTSPGA